MHRSRTFLYLLILIFSGMSLLAQSPQTSRVTEAVPQLTSPAGVNGLPDAGLVTTVTGARAILGPGDLLEVDVFDTPELTQRVRVDGDGKIHLALIGDLVVVGSSPEMVREQISEKLVAGNFLKEPQVTIFIVEYSGQIVYVTGEVNRPGAYSLLRSHRLLDLISASGGLTARAGNSVTIVRNADPKNPLHISLSDKGDTVSNPEIEPGDSITVGLTGMVYVLGGVGRPGGFLLDRRSSLTFMEALALAEGPTQSASLTNATLIHSTEPDPQPIPVNLKMILKSQSPDIKLQAGDIIWVADSQTRNLGRLALQTILATASGVAVYAAYYGR